MYSRTVSRDRLPPPSAGTAAHYAHELRVWHTVEDREGTQKGYLLSHHFRVVFPNDSIECFLRETHHMRVLLTQHRPCTSDKGLIT